ncbi:IS66 family insertion sequence element accessory protein TnpA [Paraburkholderia youngii]|uniref:IS66 family insertion sequence element accessory protein TnpA n=1 Tax=Paraburkholderia youngii TaxID=2782701 RepID=UPI003D1CC3D8
MDDATGEAVPTGARRPRQGEAFWREMVMAWTTSGLGLRRFCREQGLAVSTFGLWRKKRSSEPRAEVHPLAVTPDAAFIVSHPDAAPATPAPPSTADALSSSRDRVTLSLAGVRIELTGAHVERIVRFVLGQLGGSRC